MTKKLLLVFLSGVIFTIPSNLFIKFFEQSAYNNGIFIDYLLPKFYLSDIFVLGFIICCLVSSDKKNLKKIFQKSLNNNKIFFATIVLFLVRQFFVSHQLAAIWYTLKLIEVITFSWLLAKHHNLLKKPLTQGVIIFTTVFQSCLSLYQYHTQHSLVGYWMLGEPRLPQTFGIAKHVVNGVEKIAPYGTTAHPNLLAGILVIFLLIIVHEFTQNSPRLQLIKLVTIFLGLTTLTLTGSVSAWLSLTFGLTALLFKKRIKTTVMLVASATGLVLSPILLILFNPYFFQTPSITRRTALISQAVNTWLQNPLFGTGLNQFTTHISSYSFQELVRFIQPVHHVGLLWLTETGVLGGLLLILMMRKIPLRKVVLPLLVLTPIAALDHYLLSQQSGLLLSIFTLHYFADKK